MNDEAKDEVREKDVKRGSERILGQKRGSLGEVAGR
jgi:hypothetical protein